jgi:arabinogalactan endo-1,4-beta-galactosidase
MVRANNLKRMTLSQLRRMKIWRTAAAEWGCGLAMALTLQAADFIAGVDFSHLGFFETRGIRYQESGQPRDALSLLRSRGIQCVRLRLFTSNAAQAQADPYNYLNNLDYTLPLALRVKNSGLQLMLDFHYSDTWADPGHQAKPAAWTNLPFTELVSALRAYNSNCIAVLKAAGAMPDFVQVGNEITSGMLWAARTTPRCNGPSLANCSRLPSRA